jgi:rhodanese-related sulfurtransferase
MRRIPHLLAALPVLTLLAATPTRAMTPATLEKALAGGTPITIVDIRNPSAYAAEHIPGAINIPAALCPHKKLPPIGRLVVYGSGLPDDPVQTAAASLAAKPGIQVETLAGGLAGWKSSQQITTRGPHLKRETFNYLTYPQLKNASMDHVVLFDLRKPAAVGDPALTDLSREFPTFKPAKTCAEAVRAAGGQSTVVLVDSGDGTAEQTARLFKAGGTFNYAILAGGELALSHHGQTGSEHATAAAYPAQPSVRQGETKK